LGTAQNDRLLQNDEPTAYQIFDPVSYTYVQKSCTPVSASGQVGPATSYSDVIKCEVVSKVDTLVNFLPTVPASGSFEPSTNNWDWYSVPALRDVRFGLTAVYVRLGSQVLEATQWQVRPDVVGFNAENRTYFTVQLATDVPVDYRIFQAYDFWQMMGVLGGATLVFYGLYVLLGAGLFWALKINAAEPSVREFSSGPYQTVDDTPTQPTPF